MITAVSNRQTWYNITTVIKIYLNAYMCKIRSFISVDEKNKIIDLGNTIGLILKTTY